MRTCIFFFLITLLIGGNATGQSAAYTNAMTKAVAYLDTVGWNWDNYSLGAEKFQFISTKAPGEWLPRYYHAFCITSLSQFVKSPATIDSLTAIADADLKIADSLSPNNSEIYCLKSLNVINKINADYMRRGISYSKIANDILDISQKIDSTNPRIYYLRASYLYFRPRQFGGGKEAARPWLEKAVLYYSKAEEHHPNLQPHWGKNENEALLKKQAE